MSGDAGKKSRRAKRERESASSFSRRLGLTTHRLQRTGERVSVRLALRAVHDSVGEDAHGRRSRQQVVVPQHHLRLRVHRVHARFGVFLDSVRRFPVKLAHGLDPTRPVAVCGVRAKSTSPSRATRCARTPRRPVRECRPRARPSLSSRCSFAALFGENKRRDASVCVALPTRVGESDEFRAPRGGHVGIAGFRGRSHRAEALDTTRAEARVVARPPRWARALGRTAGAAVEAAAAATSRAKATWLRER